MRTSVLSLLFATLFFPEESSVEKLAFYGKQTNKGFKITDWRLKSLWDAIVNFVKIYGEKRSLLLTVIKGRAHQKWNKEK